MNSNRAGQAIHPWIATAQLVPACNHIPGSELVANADQLLAAWRAVRQRSMQLVAGLEPEDLNLQAAAEASPAKWHLAHSTWFFETFLLAAQPDYRWHHAAYCELFNSYYNGIGQQYSRPQRHLLSRPTVAAVMAYRDAIDTQVAALLEARLSAHAQDPVNQESLELLRLGSNHEQQHQELLLTDLLHAFSHNPLAPSVGASPPSQPDPGTMQWVEYAAGPISIGTDPAAGFCFDNETPRHRFLLNRDFALASRPVSNGEYLQFIAAGGYRQPQHWHSDGWAWLHQHGVRAPLYWRQRDARWQQMTLAGEQPLDEHAPVTHLSWYEACAYANWCGHRLPTEMEWEHAAQAVLSQPGQFAESGIWQPTMPAATAGKPAGMFGHVWEWTASPYSPYPGYRAAPGAIGEYNGKFMVNQYVLRGGSCATPENHLRSSYRNFFYPHDRWQFTGLRLARDL